MAIRSVWGFGSCLFSDGQEDTTFASALTNIDYIPIVETLPLDDGSVYTKHKGFHAKITVEVFNVDTDDHIALRWLIKRINNQLKQDTTLTIKPNYDSTQDYNLSFAVICTSNISVVNEARSGQWQSLALEFQTKDILTDISDWVESPEVVNWADMDGNFIVDQDGNQIIFSE